MSLFDPLFGTEPVCAVLSDNSAVQFMLDFEAALARAEAKVGIIPAEVAAPIAAQCKVELFKLEEIAQAAKSSGNVAIPLVRALTDLVSKSNPDAARWVHWGATSQDAIDTALVLQLRATLAEIDQELSGLIENLVSLVTEHQDTFVVARTWLQQAVPTTMGLKLAGWLDALLRHRNRLNETRKQALVLQFGGAAGTLASLGDKGLAVAEALAAELGLRMPALPWHTHRDRLVEVATTLGMLAGTLGKMARDLSLQMQTEVAELLEPAAKGRGGSSTLPHKRNPVASAVALSAAMRIPGLVSTMLSAMLQEHERGLGDWPAEWETLPEIVRLTAGSLHQMKEAIAGLEIDAAKMKSNLDLSNGMVFAEAVSMKLAEKIGKAKAHQLIETASRKAIADKKHLKEVLAQQPEVSQQLSISEIEALFIPANYLGMARAFTERVLASSKAK